MTTNTLRSSRRHHAHFPRRTGTPLPMTPAPAGSWRYHTERKSRLTLAIAAVLGLGLHSAIFFSSDAKPARTPVAAAPVEQIVQIEMPALPPEEQEQKVEELSEPQPATVAVPQLADVPSTVALTDFTQLVELRPKVDLDPNALRSVAIPVNHGRGGGGLGAVGNLFKLSDLDRIPQAIAQPVPNVPQGLRQGLDRAVVVVNFIVDAEGRVINPRIVSSTASEFDRAALDGVMRWKFHAGVKGGRKVATQMEVPLRFELTDPI